MPTQLQGSGKEVPSSPTSDSDPEGALSRSRTGISLSLCSSRGEMWAHPFSQGGRMHSPSTVSTSPCPPPPPYQGDELPFPATILTEMVLQSPSRKLRSGVRKLMEAEWMKSRSAAPKRL